MARRGVEKSVLELAADQLLAGYLKDKRLNKARIEEYPILSDYQLERRRQREIPFSSLDLETSLRLGLAIEPKYHRRDDD